MRIKLMIIMMLPLLLIECQSSLWNMITKEESKLYTDSEKVMLEAVTSSIDFKHGFDPDLEIDYVFKAGKFTDKEILAKAPEMKKILQKYDPKELIPFYEKILRMRDTQAWKMNHYKEKKSWEDSTYIQKYTLPEAELFLDILEKNMIQINPVYNEEIKKRKTK